MTRILDGHEVLGLAEWAACQGEGTLVALGLGSCVAVIFHDAEARVGGMAHVVLPSQSLARDRSRPARFAETAVPMLLGAVLAKGGDRKRMTARLVGGASMFGNLVPAGTMHMGHRNTLACHAALREVGIQPSAEAVGGESGRSVWFDVATGRVTVRRVGHDAEEI